MIVGSHTKSILVYGDSLVYGRQGGVNARLPVTERFTGVLQQLLGDGYDVIAEGLRARNMYGENPHFAERDGLQQFGPIIGSHLPVELVVLFLGTNDCNNRTAFEADVVASSLKEYVAKTKQWVEFFEVTLPKFLVILPPDIDEASYDKTMQTIFGEGASVRLKQLRIGLVKVAEDLGLSVLDASKICRPDNHDGIHLDAENNQLLAIGLQKSIVEILA